MSHRALPPPPALPAPKTRAWVGAPDRTEIVAHLKTVTPILGGAALAGKVDTERPIRETTVVSHLRFWWRALYAHRYHTTAGDLYAAEHEIFGGAQPSARRSPLEVRVQCRSSAVVDDSGPPRDALGYVLWPLRAPNREAKNGPRLRPGLKFAVSIRCESGDKADQVRAALHAWVLFGGYGGRWRRGCGSLIALENDQPASWLPASAATLGATLGLGEANVSALTDTPVLRGAAFVSGALGTDAESAWRTGVGWLQEFRQGPGTSANDARFPLHPGPNQNPVPGRSRWPEPDKLRHLGVNDPTNHATQQAHGRTPAWPRAGFGLPIAFSAWPGNLQLRHRQGRAAPAERLASPLIVKALPLRQGYAPIALWLVRGHPGGSEVVVVQRGGVVPGSAAPWLPLSADPGPMFAPLTKPSLMDAFFDWIVARHAGTKVVLP
ncbi:MAG: type III-B CRISPR module RAMP protein Cmr1 [Anaeromyxobacteraceae bacterium]|nr:type III-B CRISPR module RAMP protein Cmr1 [Anaeromyxobacteraceae bacterium]